MKRSTRFASVGALTLTALCFAGASTPAYADDVAAKATIGGTSVAVNVQDPTTITPGTQDVNAAVATGGQVVDAAVADPTDGTKPVVGGIGDGGAVIDQPGAGRGVRSAVVGYISYTNATGTPSHTLAGALADPTLWSCSGGTSATGSYTVSCIPLPNVVLSWACNVLHADAGALEAGSQIRTSMDCNGDGVSEAETDTVTGPGWDNAWAVSTMPVSSFTCTFDDGAGGAPRGKDSGGCGDPGTVEVV